MVVGLLGIPVVLAILWQSRVLREQTKPREAGVRVGGRELLLSRPILLFFGFFMLSAMAGSGMQAFVITVLGQLWATPVEIASFVLTGYMVGATSGTLVGGYVADKTKRNLFTFVLVLTLCAMGCILMLGLLPMPGWLLPVVGLTAGLCMGSSRTPRVPLGLLIDAGLAWLVLPVVAGLLGLSLLCAGGARESAAAARTQAVAAE